MNILFIISHHNAIKALSGLTKACTRRNQDYECFFTGQGVNLLQDKNIKIITDNSSISIVCEYSWQKYYGNTKSGIKEGSQTDLSSMIGPNVKVVSI